MPTNKIAPFDVAVAYFLDDPGLRECAQPAFPVQLRQSVPEIDGEDLAELQIVRLQPGEESSIAEVAEESATVRAADLLGREITADAEKIIAKFIAE
jgi:hypothetical protein